MHLAVHKHYVIVIIIKKTLNSFYRMNRYTKLLRIGTRQYTPYIYCRFKTVFFTSNNNNIIFLSQLKICKKINK